MHACDDELDFFLCLVEKIIDNVSYNVTSCEVWMYTCFEVISFHINHRNWVEKKEIESANKK